MKRRQFIKISTLASANLALIGCQNDSISQIPLEVRNDAHSAHMVLRKNNFEKSDDNIRTEFLIVGGGIAGLSAAGALKDKDYKLLELSDRLGGSSDSHNHKGVKFGQGAHYDLAYPEYYGKDVLNFFESKNIIYQDAIDKKWRFTDHQHLIPQKRESICYNNNSFEPLLPNTNEKQLFIDHLSQYVGKMSMPTRLIDSNIRNLDNITFKSFLEQSNLNLSQRMIDAIDYQMKDDYGAGSETISALAGIHYYTCRNYYKENVELFSPPEGNDYFAQKIIAGLNTENFKTRNLTINIRPHTNGKQFFVESLNIPNNRVDTYLTDNVIYAGHKHALKYIFPEISHSLPPTTYSPWAIVNIALKKNARIKRKKVFWQNEFLNNSNKNFLGFVDSFSQHRLSDKNRILNLYYCFPPNERNELMNPEFPKRLKALSIKTLQEYFDQSMHSLIEKVYIKVMGHAMPIPKPGYLFNDLNENRKYSNFVFAGVDNSRLPLLFEAVDSGISAIKHLN
ncbi:NAD(P)/FAD-dependent oxidoreductase [Aureibacter tunicatorum]|uniref:Protoporphyrinogen oxidase n=1 Tax=Aureibacter tunicatorum TaxID=866807 RepID=A0AAE4BPL1_9BACT|nr:NAD(P)-binding protein [Aureibacter tunicatorum]MDR6238104.1 protoporphyrinogen oxidase [Aureibacter tunicatorum]BDD03137.1 hypothetical protein AUTU_06200 [Aureibacter tunicatorum]